MPDSDSLEVYLAPDLRLWFGNLDRFVMFVCWSFVAHVFKLLMQQKNSEPSFLLSDKRSLKFGKERNICDISSFGFALNPFSDLGSGLVPTGARRSLAPRSPQHLCCSAGSSGPVAAGEGCEAPWDTLSLFWVTPLSPCLGLTLR